MQTTDQTTEYDVSSELLEIKRKRIRKQQYRSGVSDTYNSSFDGKAKRRASDNAEEYFENNVRQADKGSFASKGESSPFSEHSTKNRRLRKQATPNELEELRRYNNSKSFYIKKKRKNAFSRFLRRTVICLILYVIMLSSSFLIFKSTLAADNTAETSDYIYQLGSDSNIYSRKYLAWNKVRVGDIMYLNMTEIAKYCSMTVTGDSTQLRFITRDGSGEHVSFVIDSEIAYVNNVVVRMTGTCYMSDDSLYVPMSFISDYMLGIDVSYDETKNKITIKDDPDTDTISFSLKDPVRTEAIDWDSIGYEIRDQILKSMAASIYSPAEGDGNTSSGTANEGLQASTGGSDNSVN